MRLYRALAGIALLSRATDAQAQPTQALPTTDAASGSPAPASTEAAPKSPQQLPPSPESPPPAVAPPPRPTANPPQDASAPVNPAACERPGEPSEGAGAFFLGLGLFDFSSLNHHLRDSGYDAINLPLTLIGGEGHAVLPSGFVMGARGGALLSSDGSGPDGLRRTFGGGFGMVDFGYALVREKAILVTLAAGVGGYGMELGIGDGQSVPFDEVLQNPRRSSSVGRGGVLLGLTIGIDGRVSLGPAKDGGQGFFTLGARIGALYGPPMGSWSLSQGGDATGGPGPGLAGGYAALAIGFGGGRERPPR